MPCAYRHEGLYVPQHLGSKWIGQRGFGRIDPGPTQADIGGCDHDRATKGRKLLVKMALSFSSALPRTNCTSAHAASQWKTTLAKPVDAVAAKGTEEGRFNAVPQMGRRKNPRYGRR